MRRWAPLIKIDFRSDFFQMGFKNKKSPEGGRFTGSLRKGWN
jgi:hypothetical protein